eukprot:TRINITY_DN10687_c0_g2_i9.p1 TRINITY_DN10687_c0_g2~~TRINITY_DN10687_c0_g2_i9.p1  ORF type:complete len:164 (-),score=35.49 TRINITY_DN10687_c0_g2_i9:123-614(-)
MVPWQLISRIATYVAGALMIFCGFYGFFVSFLQIYLIIIELVFFLIFGILIIAAEHKLNFTKNYFYFLHFDIGKGLYFIFLAIIVAETAVDAEGSVWPLYTAAVLEILIGLYSLVCWFFLRDKMDYSSSKEEVKAPQAVSVQKSPQPVESNVVPEPTGHDYSY